MAVRLRLARIGKKHAPTFRVVAIDSRKSRDSDYLENLGTYNPQTGEYVQFHIDRFEAWLEKGALPTDSVKKLYRRFKKGVQSKAKPDSQVETPAPKKADEPISEKAEVKKEAAPAKAAPAKAAPAKEATTDEVKAELKKEAVTVEGKEESSKEPVAEKAEKVEKAEEKKEAK